MKWVDNLAITQGTFASKASINLDCTIDKFTNEEINDSNRATICNEMQSLVEKKIKHLIPDIQISRSSTFGGGNLVEKFTMFINFTVEYETLTTMYLKGEKH